MPILYPASNRFKYARSASDFRARRYAIQNPDLPPEFSPSLLFAAMEQGAWYDPSDLTTLFQDAAGTTPVTAVEQPVGLMLDKSRGLTLGPELVVNGGFDTDVSGWASLAGAAISWNSGRLQAVATTVSGPAQQLSLVVGKIYQVSGTIQGPDNVQVSLGILNNAETSFIYESLRVFRANPTKLNWVFTANETNSKIFMRCAGAGTFFLDNISVRELPGAHAFQTTATSRPVLSARVNRLLATETLATQTVTTLATTQRLRFEGTGSITLSGTGTGTFAAGTHTVTTTAGTLTVTVSGSVLRADLREANNAIGSPDYQRVNTATDYDAGPAFPRYLRADGVDDFMVTGTITPGTDKAQVFAGVRKLSDGANGKVIELGTNADTTNGTLQMEAPSNMAFSRLFGFSTRGTTTQYGFYTAADGVAPVTKILSGLGDISGDRATLRIDGTQVAQNTNDQGTGNYLAYPLYLFRRGGTSQPFNGHFYGGIIRFGPNLPIETIQQTEIWMAAKTGVTL